MQNLVLIPNHMIRESARKAQLRLDLKWFAANPGHTQLLRKPSRAEIFTFSQIVEPYTLPCLARVTLLDAKNVRIEGIHLSTLVEIGDRSYVSHRLAASLKDDDVMPLEQVEAAGGAE
jgi:hypothetical protein